MRDPLRVMRFRDDAGLSSEIGATYGLVRSKIDPETQKRVGKNHQGWDLAAHPGTQCLAVEDGVIQDLGFNNSYGRYLNLVFKKDGRQYSAFYAHLSFWTVKVGQSVKAGEIICTTGTSGNAAGGAPHLHIEFHDYVDKAIAGSGLFGRIDPAKFLGYHHMQSYRVKPALEDPLRSEPIWSTPAPSPPSFSAPKSPTPQPGPFPGLKLP